ncbi:MAG: RDD family protein [Vulcanimicrobiaceae bacterium]
MRDPLLSGGESIRYPSERAAFIACIVALPFSLALVGAFLSQAINGSRLLLLAIGALLYVSIARGKLLGDSIHVHGGQLADLARLVKECAALLDIPAPQIFVRDDVLVPIVAVGVAEPYALVISSHWLGHLRDDELRFLVARELAHVRAGHTRLSSILSVNGRENPVVSVIFGAFLRRTEYTADRIGLCCCGSLESAVKAIAIASFHHLGRSIDLAAVADQLRELRSEPTLRAGEWLGSSPYATRRITEITAFAATPLAQSWIARFAPARTGTAVTPASLSRPLLEAGSSQAFASIWRRATSWVIDFIVILTIVPSFVHVGNKNVQIGLGQLLHMFPLIASGVISGTALVLLWLYCIVLVTALGRTVGMMIVDLRVVRKDFSPPRFWDVFFRYVLAGLSVLTIVPLLWIVRRVQPYERLSGTRLVNANAVIEPQTVPAG